MDAVITYVDGLDPLWQKDYEAVAGKRILEKRFRDWGTLRYLLRGIEAHMPYVKNVYLVVSRASQVPEWADTENLKVVLHRDIIPAEFLPVFNSTAIEMFLHRIPGLDEQFIYFNDDMYPVADCDSSVFFQDGKPAIGFRRHVLACGLYKVQTRNSDMMARKALGLEPSPVFLRPQHICSPMLKSECTKAYEAIRDDILSSITVLRERKNLNQYLFLDYMYHKDMAIDRRISNRHLSLAASSADKVCMDIEHPSTSFICINDVQMPEDKYRQTRERILASFDRRFPMKSRFELRD